MRICLATIKEIEREGAGGTLGARRVSAREMELLQDRSLRRCPVNEMNSSPLLPQTCV